MNYVVKAHRRSYDNETLYTDDRVFGTASPALFADSEDDTFGLVTPLQGARRICHGPSPRQQ